MAKFKIFLILCLNTEINLNFSTFLEHWLNRGVFQKKIKPEKRGFKVENINRNACKIFHFFLEFGENNQGAETFANFVQIRERLRREKFYIGRFAKVYAREIFLFFLFFSQLVGCYYTCP